MIESNYPRQSRRIIYLRPAGRLNLVLIPIFLGLIFVHARESRPDQVAFQIVCLLLNIVGLVASIRVEEIEPEMPPVETLSDRGQGAPEEDRQSAGERFGRGAGWRVKQNESFSAAVVNLVETRNARSVWKIQSVGYAGAHFATFPPELPRRCIKASCRPGDRVLDLFGGSGTTGEVSIELGCPCTLIEIQADYLPLIRQRLANAQAPLISEVI